MWLSFRRRSRGTRRWSPSWVICSSVSTATRWREKPFERACAPCCSCWMARSSNSPSCGTLWPSWWRSARGGRTHRTHLFVFTPRAPSTTTATITPLQRAETTCVSSLASSLTSTTWILRCSSTRTRHVFEYVYRTLWVNVTNTSCWTRLQEPSKQPLLGSRLPSARSAPEYSDQRFLCFLFIWVAFHLRWIFFLLFQTQPGGLCF